MAVSSFHYRQLLALGGDEMPSSVTFKGVTWHKKSVFKHDFFAATGLYESSNHQQAVVKLFRNHAFYLFPMQWLSRLQVRREIKLNKALMNLKCVPAWTGRLGRYDLIHEYIPGTTLDKADVPDGTFFDELERLILAMHQQKIAYVDLNKLDNILVGENKKPYFFDFQLSWQQPIFPLNLICYPLFYMLKGGDLYHLKKHRLRLTDRASWRKQKDAIKPWYVKGFRLITFRVREWRRALLRSIEKDQPNRPEGAERH